MLELRLFTAITDGIEAARVAERIEHDQGRVVLEGMPTRCLSFGVEFDTFQQTRRDHVIDAELPVF